MARRDGTRLSRAVVTTVCGLVGAGLTGGTAYTHGTEILVGVAAGAVLVGALGYGVASGTMSRVTLYAVLFGLFFCMIGPGCDDYGGHMAIPAACFGAMIGWIFSRRSRVGASPRPDPEDRPLDLANDGGSGEHDVIPNA